MASASKGSAYEREICKQLSLWWTGGARDDVFWRSSGSGARAKVRGRGGKDTAGQHGDVAATDPIGKPFIDVFTVEIKRGYSSHTFQDLIDREAKSGMQEWERFLAQAIEGWELADSHSWMLITKRDRRRPLVWTPYFVREQLRIKQYRDCAMEDPLPFVRMNVQIRFLDKRFDVDACCMTLEDWLKETKPDHIKELAKRG